MIIFVNQSQQNCVIFCHGNSGNRTSIFECLNFILDRGYLAVCFDFTGCGNSDGDHITLGHKECLDLEAVVDYVKSLGYVNKIAVWGRSMGAATTLMFVNQNPTIVDAICLDSPFANLKSLIYEFIQKFKIFADIFGDILYQKVKAQIEKDCNVNIDNINPIEAANHVKVPAIFLHAIHDTIIDKDHSDKIVKLYKGRKKYYNFSGGHNDLRNDNLYNEVMNFFEELFKKSQTSITSWQGLDDQKNEVGQSFNPINFSTSSFDGDSTQDMKDDLGEPQKDRFYVNRQSKRTKIYFKTEDLINNKDNEDLVINRNSVKVQDLSFQRKQSKKQTTILLKNFVELTDDSDGGEEEEEMHKSKFIRKAGHLNQKDKKFDLNLAGFKVNNNVDDLMLRSKNSSIQKSSTIEISNNGVVREKIHSPIKNKLSQIPILRQIHSEEFNEEEEDIECEDNEKNMPNSNECFSFKKYSQYKNVSHINHDFVSQF